MIGSRRTRAAASAVLLMAAAAVDLQAWSAQGHRLVARIASERLMPMARRNVEWLLGPESLADVSSWADRYNVGAYQTFYWHFINIPPDAAGYDRDRDCPLQPTVVAGSREDVWRDCVVDRIPYNRERLADLTLDRADRAIALKFLVHFVGDLHQPFHALGVGHGGNDIPVRVFGSATCGNYPCNLHSVWDGGLVAHRGLDDEHYLAALNERIQRDGLASRPAGTPVEWAMQSRDLGNAALVAANANVDETYYMAHIGDVEQRIALGGVRLAALLNAILTTAPPDR